MNEKKYFIAPGQTGNVWCLNNIKHCLVTKHPDIEVSGSDLTQIKLHKQRIMGHEYVKNTWIQSGLASVVLMPVPNMFDTSGQTNKISPIKHENKRNVLRFLIECLMPFNFYQRPNTFKQHQTSWPNGKNGWSRGP